MTNNIVEVFPKCSPVLGSFDLDRAQKEDPHISAGEGRSIAYQALMQLLGEQLSTSSTISTFYTFYSGLAITLAVSVLLGLITGTLMSFTKLCDGISHDQLFDDDLFWETADDDNPGYVHGKEVSRRRSRARSHSLSKISEEGGEHDFADIGNNNPVKLQVPSSYIP